jgi:hypothetical protein
LVKATRFYSLLPIGIALPEERGAAEVPDLDKRKDGAKPTAAPITCNPQRLTGELMHAIFTLSHQQAPRSSGKNRGLSVLSLASAAAL